MKRFFALLLLASCGLAATATAQQGGPGYLDPQRAVTRSLSAVCNGGGGCPQNSTALQTLASGSSVCSVSVTGTFTGNIVFEQSTDGTNFQPIYVTPSAGGTPVVSTTAQFFGSAPMLGSTFFQARMSAYSAGVATTTVYCVPIRVSTVAIGPFAGGGGGSGGSPVPCPTASTNISITGILMPNCSFGELVTPGPGGTPAGGTCIGVATPPAAGTISYTCPTPQAIVAGNCTVPAATGLNIQINFTTPCAGAAQATPSPSATSTSTAGPPSCIWSGSWPYTLGCNFPVASTAAPVIVSPSPGGPIVVSTPVAGTYTVGCPLCFTRSTNFTGSWDSLVCSDASVTHCYTLNGPIGTGAGDCQADTPTGTAAPSPVPLATPTAGASSINCGAPGISNDGDTALQLLAVTFAQDYFLIPPSVLPTSGSYTIGFLTKSSPGSTSSPYNGATFCIDTSACGNLQILEEGGGSFPDYRIFYGGSSHIDTALDTTGVVLYHVIVYNGTTIAYYINCDLMANPATGTVFNVGTHGTLGNQDNTQPAYRGRIAKLFVANTAFSQSKVCGETAALGL